MPRYGLGIDAGGTYTDTVVMDVDENRILSWNKALTTREDLSKGISESLKGLDQSVLKQVSLTSLSSTLATNSIVEGKGCKVGLICIGTDCPDSSQAEICCRIEGKFSYSGTELIPVNPQELTDALLGMKDRVDALAVSGYISVRNPSHELLVEEYATRLLGIPVVCAHTLTSKLGFEQRTTTAVMNARLIPTIRELIDSVKSVLDTMQICTPLMIVKGDGSLMDSEVALRRPIETILSGPASSIMGAKALTGLEDAMVIDIGGTTSDIGIIRNGKPRIGSEGASITGKRTRVMAVDLSTYGIGGDSRIVVNGKTVHLSPAKVIPLCIAAKRWDEVRKTVETLSDIVDDRSEESYDLSEVVQDTEFFILAHDYDASDLMDADRDFLALIRERPYRLCGVSDILGVPAHSLSVAELEKRGIILRIGITPTDILHAEGTYTEYEMESSRIAVGYLARKCSKTLQEFLTLTKSLIVEKITSSALEKALTDESGRDSPNDFELELIRHTVEGDYSNITLRTDLRMPIIGIGAPVKAWLPEVSRKLGAELILPEYAHVGNAVGAITGSVSESVTFTVRAIGDRPTESPQCNVFTGQGTERFDTPEEAMEYARARCGKMAHDAALCSGSVEPVTHLDEQVDYIEIGPGIRFFRGAVITATSVGKPSF